MLQIINLIVSIASDSAGASGKEILKGVSLTIKPGEIHALMGPNGAGKSTLALSLMGHPGYKFEIRNSKFEINGKDVSKLLPEERARRGLFVAFQAPVEVTGVSVLAFLRTAFKALYPNEQVSLADFKKRVVEALKEVHLDETFMQRYLNEGFSGGEKKRMEVAQLLVLKPKFAIMDEIDSGLDVDSLRIVAKALFSIAKKENIGMLVITHYQRILHFLKPDVVHILVDGKIKKTGGLELVEKIEKEGYVAI